jgi:peptidoglycan hydrolase-like protein with peptidoglycan-binding domain
MVLIAVILSGGFIGQAEAARTWPTLKKGNSGEDVVTLQAKLRYRGYTVPYNGSFDDATEQAVKLFQTNNGLVADGIVGHNTWEKLVVTVRQGNKNIVVEALQRQLKNEYHYTVTVGVIDSDFGWGTYDGVVSFQKSVNLGADGIVGPDTWSHILSNDSTRMHHSNAVQSLQGNGIAITSSSGAAGVGSDRHYHKTSLEQVRKLAIDRLIEFKRDSGCAVTVTGGTETWIHSSGTYSHHTGYKIDISPTTCVSNYITRNYTSIGGSQYEDSRGNIYYDEAKGTSNHHWDILYRY